MTVRRRVLVTGCRGRLGTELMRFLSDDFDMLGVDRHDLDVTDSDKVFACIRTIRPDVVLHTAAVTNVDACEKDPAGAISVNDTGAGNVARACEESHAALVCYSTDYVFDGRKCKPYTETDLPNPVNRYGQSKLAGERTVLALCRGAVVLRVAWLYGIYGSNFVKSVVQGARSQQETRGTGKTVAPMRIIEDQTGTPTWTAEVARQTRTVVENDLSGVLHATANGSATWLEWAKLILSELALVAEIQPCKAQDFWGGVPRPVSSVLENVRLRKAGMDLMRPWDIALGEFLAQYKRELLA
ncbi:MAG: dTDP-4-dehydrorhamnose reductase [Candidatus Zixiibacteriota bacterium]